jgi:hypothetical protein
MGLSQTATTLAMSFVRPMQKSNVVLQNRAMLSSNTLATSISNFHFRCPTSSRLVAAAHPVGMTALDPATTTAAINFFNGSQLPVIFIAGASLAGIFAMTEGVNNTNRMSKLQVFLLRLYHLTSLLSFCLSLSSLVTSRTATTLLLLSDFSMVPQNQQKLGLDAYQFLRSNLNFEFLYTRWSFLISVPFLIVSTTIRMLLQFELFKPKRRLAGWSVVSTMTGLLTFIIGYSNTTQHCWPSLWGLTQEIFHIIWKRAYLNRQPMFLASVVSFGIGIVLTTRFLLPGAVKYDQLADHDRYT